MDTQMPALGSRGEAIVSLVPACDTGAEIGADHGILSAHLLRRNTCRRMVVADISAASLSKAERLFAAHELEARADFRVADGLDAIGAPVGAIVIAGMGSRGIQHILLRGMNRVGEAKLVLQANLDVPPLRRFLVEHGFCLEAERLAREGGRFYIALRAARGAAHYTDKQLLLGPCLSREKPEGWSEYLGWRRGCLQRMRGEAARRDLSWIEEAMWE